VRARPGCSRLHWRSQKIDISNMNRIQITKSILAAVAGLALLSGCSSTGPTNGAGASAQPSNDGFVPPFRGETRDQVIAQYDEPDQVFQSSETVQTWIYYLGKAKQFIPFYGPWAKRQVLVIHFDQSGRVIGWESHSNRPD
jgi:hypothetical protein